MIEPAQIVQTMERYVQLVDAGDIPGIVALYAENAEVEDPVGQPRHVGIDAIERFYREGLGRAQARARLEGPVRAASNGSGAVPFRVELMMGGRPCVIRVIDVMQFNAAGQITLMQAYWSGLNVEVGE